MGRRDMLVENIVEFDRRPCRVSGYQRGSDCLHIHKYIVSSVETQIVVKTTMVWNTDMSV